MTCPASNKSVHEAFCYAAREMDDGKNTRLRRWLQVCKRGGFTSLAADQWDVSIGQSVSFLWAAKCGKNADMGNRLANRNASLELLLRLAKGE